MSLLSMVSAWKADVSTCQLIPDMPSGFGFRSSYGRHAFDIRRFLWRAAFGDYNFKREGARDLSLGGAEGILFPSVHVNILACGNFLLSASSPWPYATRIIAVCALQSSSGVPSAVASGKPGMRGGGSNTGLLIGQSSC